MSSRGEGWKGRRRIAPAAIDESFFRLQNDLEVGEGHVDRIEVGAARSDEREKT